MDPILLAGLLGAIGGLTRGVVGLLKALSLRRRIIWSYYLITVFTAIIIGIFVGIVLTLIQDYHYFLGMRVQIFWKEFINHLLCRKFTLLQKLKNKWQIQTSLDLF